MESVSMASVGIQIKQHRIECGLSQEELSSRCGIERAQISKIESGLVEGVTYSTISRIYDGLGMALVPTRKTKKQMPLHPFVKWAGGKTQLLDVILRHMPETYGRYFEPFVGGGALLLKLQPERFSINDMNEELISVYRCLCDDVLFDALVAELDRHQQNHSEDYYYKVRSMDKEPDFSELPIYIRAGRMIYLNKACFNGLYRVNSKGFFNVPFGKKKKVNCYDSENLRALHEYFKTSKPVITHDDFAAAVADAKEGDFVYFDPPYDTWEDKDSFTSYGKDDFGKEAQARLAATFRELDARGVKVMLSNHNTRYISQLYEGFHINVVPAKRLINSNAAGRGEVEEVLITNYE